MARTMLSREYCDDQLLIAIGSIAAESAYLERFVETLIYRLTKLTREMGYPIVEAGMLGSKLDLLTQVGRVKLNGKEIVSTQFSDLMSRIKHANSERILAVHGVWLHEHENFLKAIMEGLSAPPVVALKRNKDGKPDTKLEKKNALLAAKQISDLHHDLHEFATRNWPTLFPRPGTRAFARRFDQKPPRHRKVAKRQGSPQSP